MSLITTNLTGSYIDYHVSRQMLCSLVCNNAVQVAVLKQIACYVQSTIKFHMTVQTM